MWSLKSDGKGLLLGYFPELTTPNGSVDQKDPGCFVVLLHGIEGIFGFVFWSLKETRACLFWINQWLRSSLYDSALAE